MKKKIALVSGGAGFIGSHLVDLLLKNKFKVRVLDNFSTGRIFNIKHHLKNKNFSYKKLNICKIKPDENLFKSVDFVFHFAGIADLVPSIERPQDYMATNTQGTINMLLASTKSKVKKFVYAASASCYGMTNNTVSENSKINTEHPYAFSKYLGELAVFQWHKVYKLPVNTIRIFNAYGPRSRTSGAYGAVMGVFFKQKIKNKPLTVVGDGNQSRDFVHVKDVARAFLAAAKSKSSGKAYNVGTGNPQKINKLVKLIGGKTVNIPNRPGETRRSCANINRIKKDLKWKPTISFTKGINDLMKNIHDWSEAPLWTPKSIKKATKIWFKQLSKKK